MKKALAVVILLACLAGADVMVGRSSLSGEQASAGEFEQEMMIGLLAPLDGERAEEGRSTKRGFELATAGLRTWGTATVLEDSRCDVQYAKGALERLLQAGSEVVVGALCPEVASLAEELLAEQGIALISLNAGEPATAWRLDAQIDKKEALADYFVDGHIKHYGSAPDYTSALAFDVLTAVAMELRDNTGGAEELLEHLRVTEHYGVSGVVKFRGQQ